MFGSFFLKTGQWILWFLVMALAIIFFSYLGLGVMDLRDASMPVNLWEAISQAGSQSLEYIRMLLHGNLGAVVLVMREEPVLDILKTVVKNSLGLLGISLVAATVLGVWFGSVAAFGRRSEGAYGMLFFTMLGVSIPAFLVAVLLQRGGIWYTTTFGRMLVNMGGFGWDYKHMTMPVLVLMARPFAHITRLVYISLTDIMKKDYIRTARAKGVHPRQIHWVHAGLNLATSLLTAIGVSLRYSLGILPLVEFIFGWPGLGLYALTAIRRRLPLLLIATALVFGFTIHLINTVIENANKVIDPSLRGEA